MVRTDNFIRKREFSDYEVTQINFILKARSKKFIASSKEEWLYPESTVNCEWSDLKSILLPPEDELWHYGGGMYVGYQDGSTYFQDAFGRETPENEHLKKELPGKKTGRNDACPCGSGRKYKKCCKDKPDHDKSSWTELSIRERNEIFYRGVYDILGINKGKTWETVRREFSDDHVVDIHNLYWSLWPKETDLLSLLPKSDNLLRAIYTGMLDPRLIFIPLSLAPYFDEILIQHPFVHPKAVNKDFSPTENPHQHKYQTFKNIVLLLKLEPFVQKGVVNFYPDPCVFDNHIRRELYDMASTRRGNEKMDEGELKRAEALGRDDFMRTLRGLDKEQLQSQIIKAMPELSQEEIEELIVHFKNENEQDPLALLQDGLYSDGGQLMLSSMSPNFEMLLFLSQLTGSLILTDSPTRWKEVTSSFSLMNGAVKEPWKNLTDTINQQSFLFCHDPDVTFRKGLLDGKFGNIKKVFRELLVAAKNGKNEPPEPLIDRYIQEFLSGLDASKDVFAHEKNIFTGKMTVAIPQGGIVHTNTQRLLIKAGSEQHLERSPMAIFFELY